LKKTIIALILIALSVSPLRAADKLSSEELKTLFAVGANVARSLAVFNLTPAEFEVVLQGITETRAGKKPDFELTAYDQNIQGLVKARRKATGEKQAAAGKKYLEKAALEKNAIKTPSGMVYIPLVAGKGDSPKATDTVKVNYRGTLSDGVTEFDSSYKRGRASEFKLDAVIKCWSEGLQLMKPGGKARIVCPPGLAYGDTGTGELILPGATLNFDIELLEVKAPSLPSQKGGAKQDKPAASTPQT
jgi:FKBP-type peptidyl-prolyl cis-trans isomerase FkpA